MPGRKCGERHWWPLETDYLALVDDRDAALNQLQRELGSITHRTLSRQLRELEHDGIVHRKDFGTVPPHVEYSLTPLGRSLGPVLNAMHDWGEMRDEKLQDVKLPD